MAVGVSTASETSCSGPDGPVRTCVGCRQRAAATDLLRVVVAPDPIGKAAHQAPARSTSGARGPSDELGGGPVALPVVPDPRRRFPGRGAWVHPDRGCVELAQRRRAFGRALKVPGPVDPAPVLDHLARIGTTVTRSSTQDTTSGTPQEMKSYGHSMKRQP